jgi:hypothetical protein
MNGSTGPVPFAVADNDTSTLVFTASSSDTTVVTTPAGVSFGGSGVSRTVTVTPNPNAQGSTFISVVVSNSAHLTATNTFRVTVGAPTISAIADQVTATNTPTAAIPFTVGDAETPNGLTVTGTSSDQAVVQNSDIAVSPTGTSRTVTITPMPNATGLATITLTVSDGTNSVQTAFRVTVYAKYGLLVNEPFTYADGDLPGVSASRWIAHSAAASNDAYVVSGQLRVSATNAEDVSVTFSNLTLFPVNSGGILYSKFDLNCAVLPVGSGGSYFAHYRDTTTSNFRARLFAATNGVATPGTYRLGVANGAFAITYFPMDLSPGTTYTVVTRYNVGTATTTLWVNPTSEASPSVTSGETATPIEIDYFCFRQDNTSNPNAGVQVVDNLLVGTEFTDVVSVTTPSAIPLRIQQLGNNTVLTWTNPVFKLQATPLATGTYTNVPGASSPYTNTSSADVLFYRLAYP